jgi:molecular chaperone GrpE (heat shock protein)
MMQQPAPDDVEEGTVLQEIRRGYRLDDQVLRHSRVIVAS